MSMYPGHRGLPHQGGSSRLNELLEQVRAEFDNQVRVNEDYERQSKPIETGTNVQTLTCLQNSPAADPRGASHPGKGLPTRAGTHEHQAKVSHVIGRDASTKAQPCGMS